MGALNHLPRPFRQEVEITDSDLSRLESALTRCSLRKGDSLVVQSTNPVAGIVAKGCLRVYFTESDGSERVLYFAPEGWLVPGEEEAIQRHRGQAEPVRFRFNELPPREKEQLMRFLESL